MMQQLQEYQKQLEQKYGKYWVASISENEREKYIDLYHYAHEIPRVEVDQMLQTDLKRAYEEKINTSSKKEDKYIPENNEMIKFLIRTGVDDLKIIYSKLNETSQDNVIKFNNLYKKLSELSKSNPINLEEDRKRFSEIQITTNEIETLKNELSSQIKI